jgi:hypothetical protein
MFEGVYHLVMRLIKYDELCIEDNFFIVKKKNKIKSETKLVDINVIQSRPWFEFFGTSWIILRCEGTWLFQYKTSELSKEDNEKLINKLKEGVKQWQTKL